MSNADIKVLHQGLAALKYWILNFAPLEYCECTEYSKDISGLDHFDDLDFLRKLIDIVKEIFDVNENIALPLLKEEAWVLIINLVNKYELSMDFDRYSHFESQEYQFQFLSELLCYALSDKCKKRHDYIAKIMSMSDRTDVQRELMRILQENTECNSDVEDSNDTKEYSTLMDASMLNTFTDVQYDDEHDHPAPSVTSDGNKLELIERDASITVNATDDPKCGCNSMNNLHACSEKNELRSIIEHLQKELRKSVQQEMSLASRLDEIESQHKAEMIQLESESMRAFRNNDEKYCQEILELKRELETLRESDEKYKQMKERVTILQDELDVLQFSNEQLSTTKEHLRKCREQMEQLGDTQDALKREEKARVASVNKCIALENELALLKPLKRQLEEYKARTTTSEVALAECREDLRRLKEKSLGLEGINDVLKRNASLQQAEVGNFQKQIQVNEDDTTHGRMGIGVGMSELNPELMSELNMLRSEYIRLKEFESQREGDAVQRMIESSDDARRLSEKFKEQYISTKSQLENTQQLLHESEERESKLQDDIKDWEQKYNRLGKEMKEERLRSQKAAIDAERKFQNQKIGIIDKARQDLKELEQNLLLKIDNERRQHRESTERALTERDETEKRLMRQLAELREQSSSNLRIAKETAQKKIDEIELNNRIELDKFKIEKEKEIDDLTTKGKGMLLDWKQKVKGEKKELIEYYCAKTKALEDDLTALRKFQEDFEKKAVAKLAKRDQQIHLLEVRNFEATRVNNELEENTKKVERKLKELTGDNDRLRRQLGSRFGPGAASKNQLDELVSVCNSLREENHRLKGNANGFLNSKPAAEPTIAGSPSHETMPAMSKIALIEYREEFEDRIKSLENEKRDLIMRNSAALSEVQKAEKRSWELEEELTKIKSELTTVKLAIQRNERRADLSSDISRSCQKDNSSVKENANPNNLFCNAKIKTNLSLMDHACKPKTSDTVDQSECTQS